MAKSSMRGSAPSNAKSKENMKTKKKKKNAKRLLRAPDAAAQKSVKPVKENPFESIWSRRKLDVMGKGRKGDGRRVGLARSRAVEKRKKTLLKDYERSRKSSMFVDKRIGENDDEMGEFDKGILRLQRERQLKLKKENKYNLPDGEEDDSGLQEAEMFSDMDDFQDEVPLDDDDDYADQAQKQSWVFPPLIDFPGCFCHFLAFRSALAICLLPQSFYVISHKPVIAVQFFGQQRVFLQFFTFWGLFCNLCNPSFGDGEVPLFNTWVWGSNPLWRAQGPKGSKSSSK
ncbi:hypothetical protein Taro_027683, partial [Colocasia esculenta]|nr:hypothetical protein [Colocasia esculenta]